MGRRSNKKISKSLAPAKARPSMADSPIKKPGKSQPAIKKTLRSVAAIKKARQSVAAIKRARQSMAAMRKLMAPATEEDRESMARTIKKTCKSVDELTMEEAVLDFAQGFVGCGN